MVCSPNGGDGGSGGGEVVGSGNNPISHPPSFHTSPTGGDNGAEELNEEDFISLQGYESDENSGDLTLLPPFFLTSPTGASDGFKRARPRCAPHVTFLSPTLPMVYSPNGGDGGGGGGEVVGSGNNPISHPPSFHTSPTGSDNGAELLMSEAIQLGITKKTGERRKRSLFFSSSSFVSSYKEKRSQKEKKEKKLKKKKTSINVRFLLMRLFIEK